MYCDVSRTHFGKEREKEASSPSLSHPRCCSGSKYGIDIENEETYAEKEDQELRKWRS